MSKLICFDCNDEKEMEEIIPCSINVTPACKDCHNNFRMSIREERIHHMHFLLMYKHRELYGRT